MEREWGVDASDFEDRTRLTAPKKSRAERLLKKDVRIVGAIFHHGLTQGVYSWTDARAGGSAIASPQTEVAGGHSINGNEQRDKPDRPENILDHCCTPEIGAVGSIRSPPRGRRCYRSVRLIVGMADRHVLASRKTESRGGHIQCLARLGALAESLSTCRTSGTGATGRRELQRRDLEDGEGRALRYVRMSA